MPNDSTSPSAPPARGFAGIATLVSDVSADLRAVEVATAAAPPPGPPQPPKPVRIGPSEPEPTVSHFSSVPGTTPSASASSGETPWSYYIALGILAAMWFLAKC